MAIDAFMVFVPSSGPLPTSESTIDFGSGISTLDPFGVSGLKNSNVFEVDDYSFDVDQTLSISGSGSGAGKIVFNPLKVTRQVDLFSETLFLNSATGTLFKAVDLILRKTTGGSSPDGATFLAYRFGTCGVDSIATGRDEEAPRETVGFEYGTLSIAYAKQSSSGTFGSPVIAGWDRVRNVRI